MYNHWWQCTGGIQCPTCATFQIHYAIFQICCPPFQTWYTNFQVWYAKANSGLKMRHECPMFHSSTLFTFASWTQLTAICKVMWKTDLRIQLTGSCWGRTPNLSEPRLLCHTSHNASTSQPPPMPIHIVSNDTKLHIPALFFDGYTVKEICSLLGVKKMLIYKTLNFYRRFSTVYSPHTYSHIIRHCCILSTMDILSIQNMGDVYGWCKLRWCS